MSKKQEDEVRLLVREALKGLTKEGTPNFYNMIQTADGYRKAEDLIINYAVKNIISITAAIAQLESTLSDTQ